MSNKKQITQTEYLDHLTEQVLGLEIIKSGRPVYFNLDKRGQVIDAQTFTIEKPDPRFPLAQPTVTSEPLTLDEIFQKRLDNFENAADLATKTRAAAHVKEVAVLQNHPHLSSAQLNHDIANIADLLFKPSKK